VAVLLVVQERCMLRKKQRGDVRQRARGGAAGEQVQHGAAGEGWLRQQEGSAG
jgi:hypothetical protein